MDETGVGGRRPVANEFPYTGAGPVWAAAWGWGAAGWGWLAPLVAVLGAAAILVLYLLRRRPRQQVVPSTLLWRLAARDTVARHPWQRFRSRLSFWLELLAALALALALARPLLPGGAPAAAGAVWVLDATASMAAGDRWEQALATIREDLRHAGPGFRGALLWAGPELRWLAGPGASPAAIAAALDRTNRPSGGTTDWAAALALAYGAAAGLPPESPVRVVTDGSDPALAAQLARPPAGLHPLQILTVGQPEENTAIVAAGPPVPAAALPEGATEGPGPAGSGAGPSGPQTATITVTLVHYGRAPAEVDVLVEPATLAGTPWTGPDPGPPPAGGSPGAGFGNAPSQRVRLEPGRPAEHRFTVPAGAPLYRVALVPGDAYPLDDVAWAVPAARPGVRIGLLAAGQAGLIERALALRPGATVVRLLEEGAPGSRPALASLDLLVVAGHPLPAGLPETLPVIWIDPPGPTAPELAGQARPAAGASGSPTGSPDGGGPPPADAGPPPGEPAGPEAPGAPGGRGAAGAPGAPGAPGGPGARGAPTAPGAPGAPSGLGSQPGTPQVSPGSSRPFRPQSLAVPPGGRAARLLALVPLEGVTLLSARPLVPGPGEEPLLLGDGRPIATYRAPAPGQGGRVVLGFDPYQGTLLLRPVWPLLVQALVDDLAPGGLGAPTGAVAGHPLPLAPSPWVTAVTVRTPSGRVLPAGAVADEPGLYRITARAVERGNAAAQGGPGAAAGSGSGSASPPGSGFPAEEPAAGPDGAGSQGGPGTLQAAVWVRPDPLESAAVAQSSLAEAARTGTSDAAAGTPGGVQPGADAGLGAGSQPGTPAAAGDPPGSAPPPPGSSSPAPAPAGTTEAWRWAAWAVLAALAAGTWVVRHEL
ncbi:BatA domain-containing protein [Thermaerobacter litoralis]